MLKQSLQQKLLQKLSPQQIQLIKLLEIPTMQLEQRIKQELEENPLLEEGQNEVDEINDNNEDEITDENLNENSDEFSLEDYINDEDIPSYKLVANNYSKDDKKEEIPFTTGASFHEHLQNQIGLRNLTEKEQVLAWYLIGNIDDDGYVRRKLEAIANDLAFSQNIETNEDELLNILRIIQDLEPVGVGARNLQECLILQINSKNQELPEIQLARKILKYYFIEFTKKHYDKILTRLDISENQLKDAVNEILKLNPKPGSTYSDSQSRVIQTLVPDFILETKDGELLLSLNSKNVPELRLSNAYNDIIETYTRSSRNERTKSEKEAITFVKQKLDSAKWFIDAIKQRQNTLFLTMNAIVEYQHKYFIEGDETFLRPMILKDIAEKTGLDISTISRVANSKYVQTNFGIFPLKYFFSEGLQTESGEEVSTREIKSILKECIDNEAKKKPLTDDKLTSILKEKGYLIARRTVAKYREQLGIPVARLRKEL
ncbi:MAG: RNA polymerase sigma-54 factor [Bacteroidetes bacterium GWC2_33_15]|nr:MAG: RNA polymerase sigma-54 factor [Bacteroidetes bacterium GWA2_33_15]OFX49418.1 MAG: RNA polymerase sigma-54 factor [Bacteroidetes bacterium GWC2_33_15]OFX62989.1 MAG: RNA polymerase sigma-54 factor [Bacteroidetes bacterium GWB2_32_14]OFX68766.1 MAG: RNA polymerase sigma-54 factor [Bacteroidetes bacterium GWD2_33_33]HAN19059.1 RNA polymerase sigma-54 factor [Bacteroidales bacterium]